MYKYVLTYRYTDDETDPRIATHHHLSGLPLRPTHIPLAMDDPPPRWEVPASGIPFDIQPIRWQAPSSAPARHPLLSNPPLADDFSIPAKVPMDLANAPHRYPGLVFWPDVTLPRGFPG